MRNAAPLPDTPHDCRYREEVVWTRWKRSDALAERLARRLPLCEICGKERPARQPRPPVLREVRADLREPPPLPDATGQTVAQALVRLGRGREGLLPTVNFFAGLKRRGIPPAAVEQWIDAFLRAGWLTVLWRPGRPPVLVAVALRRPKALRDLVRVGGASPRKASAEAGEG